MQTQRGLRGLRTVVITLTSVMSLPYLENRDNAQSFQVVSRFPTSEKKENARFHARKEGKRKEERVKLNLGYEGPARAN